MISGNKFSLMCFVCSAESRISQSTIFSVCRSRCLVSRATFYFVFFWKTSFLVNAQRQTDRRQRRLVATQHSMSTNCCDREWTLLFSFMPLFPHCVIMRIGCVRAIVSPATTGNERFSSVPTFLTMDPLIAADSAERG